MWTTTEPQGLRAGSGGAPRPGGAHRAKALECIQSILYGICGGQDVELSKIVEAKSDVLTRYQRVFSDKDLPRLARGNFIGFLKFKNNRHWTGIIRYGPRITECMGALREALRILLDESRPLRERLDRPYPPSGGKLISGLGSATFTPILFVRHPEKHGVYKQDASSVAQGAWAVGVSLPVRNPVLGPVHQGQQAPGGFCRGAWN